MVGNTIDFSLKLDIFENPELLLMLIVINKAQYMH